MVEHLRDGSFFMYFKLLNFLICILAGFGQFLLFLHVFLSFWGRKAPQNTHQTKSTLLDNRDTSEMDHVSYSANEQTFYLACWQFLHWLWFLQAFQSVGEKCPQNTCLAICSHLYNKNSWEMDYFLCTSNGWLCVLFPDSFWTAIMVPVGISFIWKNKNLPQKYPSLQQKHLKHGYFLCSYNSWIFILVSW